MTFETKEKIKNAFLDRGLNKLISRKLMVWLCATIGVPLNYITGEDWIQISMVYIGSQAAMDFVLNYVKAKNGNQQWPQTLAHYYPVSREPPYVITFSQYTANVVNALKQTFSDSNFTKTNKNCCDYHTIKW
jgi:hypothetical protein